MAGGASESLIGGSGLMPPALLLVGGRGTRLGSVCDKLPKPLLPVAGKAFLEHIVHWLVNQGVRRFFFLTGHLGEQVADYFAGRPLPGVTYSFVQERMPLGTGGSVRAALGYTGLRERFLLLNGDSFVPFPVARLVEAAKPCAGALLAGEVREGGRYGSLEVSSEGILTGFAEKRGGGAPRLLVNLGVYCLGPELFWRFPEGRPYSIETDFYPAWIAAGERLAVIKVHCNFIDIGTPESLQEAEKFVTDLQEKGIM
ncbi:MAG TPA: sugar phosphate nucleotidyltransferase [Verrucomicrobiae bacterium]|nr:sugar phosphate nucleotidyltransferase [Verrucomicrobiae bacterium]